MGGADHCGPVSGGGGGSGRRELEPGEALRLVWRAGGTYDYRWEPPLTREMVPHLLREIAAQIEAGADVPDPE